VKKSDLGDLIWKCYKFAGHDKTVTMLDKLKKSVSARRPSPASALALTT